MNERPLASIVPDEEPATRSQELITRRTVSTVTPVKDEEESLPVLVAKILEVSQRAGLHLAEIILVDDGSTDRTWEIMEELAESHPQVLAIRLRRNFGKSTALMVGVGAASGDIIVTLDGDLQDDPEELPRFVEYVEAGNDLVSGWKQQRDDPLSKTIPSRIFNAVTAHVSGIGLHDFNCGYKAYRREIFNTLQLYGELHRYIPVLAHAVGYRVSELPVRHHARQFGRSKYGMSRLLRGFLDLLTVLMLTRFAYRPSHLFGGIGVLLSIAGAVILAYLATLKILTGLSIGDRPLLLLGVLLAILGVQLLLFGMLAELVISRSPRVARFEDLVVKRTDERTALP